jgi:hypothetical protein
MVKVDNLIEQEAEKAYDKALENFQYPKGVINSFIFSGD